MKIRSKVSEQNFCSCRAANVNHVDVDRFDATDILETEFNLGKPNQNHSIIQNQ